MIRILLWGLLLFSLPFAVAYFWLALVKKSQPSQAELKVWAIAASVGLFLVLGSLFILRSQSGCRPKMTMCRQKSKTGRCNLVILSQNQQISPFEEMRKKKA